MEKAGGMRMKVSEYGTGVFGRMMIVVDSSVFYGVVRAEDIPFK